MFTVFLRDQACFAVRFPMAKSFCKKITIPVDYDNLSPTEKCRSEEKPIKCLRCIYFWK